MTVPRRLRIVLALAGLALAVSGGVLPRPRADGASVVAVVNDVAIPYAALERTMRRAPVGASPGSGERIEALIDEELLIQRAREIGLVESDRSVRKALVNAVLERVKDEAAAQPMSEDELRAFHAENGALFSTSRRVRVRAIRFATTTGVATALTRARDAATAIAGGMTFEDAAGRFGDHPGLPVPDALLPDAVLRRELGPTLHEAVLALGAGEISAPTVVGDAVHLLHVAELVPGAAPPFEIVRARVAHELRRRRGEEALARLVAALRARAVIVSGGPPS
jgi:parvulin-like peptidyl-prolyl isomerase